MADEDNAQNTDAPASDDQAKPEEEKKEEATPEEKPAEAKTEEKPAEEAKEDDKPSKEYSKEVGEIVEKVEKMTVLEVADLVSAIEDKFGVSAAPVAVAGAAPAGGDGDGGGDDEKSSFTVHLTAAGDKKIEVIKAVREVTDLGLKEAKDLVDGAPKDVKTDVPKDEAEEAKKKLEAAGGTVDLK
ncbi:50S ribosomal protein L7/L12 [Patescibacteria group bacterium]|nr:50S ribosomal protein L7/L12 [Patescibacteria group bacterium]